MADYFQDGDLIDYTPGSAVAAGDVVVIGSLVAVAPRPIAANTLGAVAVEGVWSIAKGAENIAAGTKVNYYATSGVVTAASTGVACGYAVAAAATGASTVKVLLLQKS